MKNLAIAAFITLACIQLMVPAQMIWKKEMVVRRGALYKFETAPVDPAHPFIGKYIRLDFNDRYSKFPAEDAIHEGQQLFVTYKKDKRGFATIAAVSTKKPNGNNYLETTVTYISEGNDTSMAYFDLPFNRLYMEEYKAPRAEIMYRGIRRDSVYKTYAVVSLYRGDAVIKDVFINDTSVYELLKKE